MMLALLHESVNPHVHSGDSVIFLAGLMLAAAAAGFWLARRRRAAQSH